MTIVFVLLGIVVGFLIGFLLNGLRGQRKLSDVKELLAASRQENENLRTNLTDQKQLAENQKQELEARFQKSQEEQEKLSQERILTLKSEFQSLSQQVMDRQTQKMSESGQNQFDKLVRPLTEHLESLHKALMDSNEKRANQTGLFENSMKRLEEQTTEIGRQTERLTQALKGESKAQGDWGEMLLDSILEQSGLRKNFEYVVQENVKSETNQNLRPDVIVRFPDERNVVIDSKVSLSAYMDYLNATDADDQKRFIQQHVNSVRSHVNELAAKDYSTLVENTDNYVLMFLQSDAAYVLAVKSDTKLNQEAFSKHVIITCPTTLMMTLQIIYNIWQSDRQNRNVERIVALANSLYDKFVNFTDTFREIEKNIQKTQSSYEKALNQLSVGKGNLVRTVSKFPKLGANPKKQLSPDLVEEAESDVLPGPASEESEPIQEE